MAFWGIEIKPGKPVTHSFDKVRRRLRISQATLGIGSVMKKTLVQCNVGERCPIFLCALLPDKMESCHLDLEFEEPHDVVFSVIGPRSVYLTGYYVGNSQHSVPGSDTETNGEDIANTETEESVYNTDEDEYEDSFIDDDDEPEVFPTSPVSSDQDEKKMQGKHKMRERNGIRKLQRKRIQVIDSDHNSTSQESGDEDNFSFSLFKSKKKSAKKAVSEVEEEDIEPKESWKDLAKEADTLEDNLVNHGDGPVDIKSQEESGKIDNSRNLVASNEHQSVRKKKLKRKRTEQSEEKKSLEGGSGNHGKVLKQDKMFQIEAEIDGKPPDHIQLDKNTQKPVDGGFIGSVSLPPPEVSSENDQISKRRRKAGTGERSIRSDNGTCSNILVEDHNKEPLQEACKMNEDQPATSEENKKTTASRASVPVAEKCKPEKAKKKKKKSKALETNANFSTNASILSENESKRSPLKLEERDYGNETSQARTLSNGLTIQELAPGENDGRVATLGRKVKVFYTAKLKDSGHIFDSNIGKSPYKFRLGDETVIEGWNVGLQGMRIGGKRRLTIPPSMGFGHQGTGENVPPNSWLVYEVELASAR